MNTFHCEVVGSVSTLDGIFGSCFKDGCHCDVGPSRVSKEKGDTLR
jgi:hypothetical protein